MNGPDMQKPIYYVYGVWNCYDSMPLVWRDNGPEVHKFDELDEALAFIKERTPKNVNINWCLTSNPNSVKPTRVLSNEQAIDLIESIKAFCFLTGEQVYPVVSSMCRYGMIENWKCVDDVFYIGDTQVAP